jgi:hypothetical protein
MNGDMEKEDSGGLECTNPTNHPPSRVAAVRAIPSIDRKSLPLFFLPITPHAWIYTRDVNG